MSMRLKPTRSATCALKKMTAATKCRISSTTRSAAVTGSGTVVGSAAAVGLEVAARRDLAWADPGMQGFPLCYFQCILF